MTLPFEPFQARIRKDETPVIRRTLDTLQVNIGKLCNQACKHCHVDSGPWRTELMNAETIEHLLRFAKDASVKTLDITGGAPEMNPEFFKLVPRARAMGIEVIDRCNLTVLFEPGQENTAQFLADHGVQVVASLPCYLKENVNRQRGGGVFGKSIDALRRLNSLGYGKGHGLSLNLVYNPTGTSLPPPQGALEEEYRRVLEEEYGIVFDNLYTITNMPIHRFAEDLKRKGEYVGYMQKLIEAHNPSAVANVMCTSLVSVSWDGYLYDCDFNQMLEMNIRGSSEPLHISSVRPEDLTGRAVALGDHCYGCTAGAGSSCGGSLVPDTDRSAVAV